MKILNSAADRMLRLFLPSLTGQAHSCPSNYPLHVTQSRRCGISNMGIQYRHGCCGGGISCIYQAWSRCYY